MPETFSPIIWHNDTVPAINETNLNRLEVGVQGIDARVDAVERGVTAPVTVPYATSVTLNATQGGLFRCVATGDLTLDDIVGGSDGQTIVFEVQASGAQRALHFTGSTDVVTIAVGQWWVGVFRFVASANSWLLDDGSGGGASTDGSGNELNILAPQNVPYAGSITLNAATGALFRITAAGNFTLNDPINGTDGQAVVLEVLASGGSRTVSFASGAVAVTIPTGARWTATLRYNQTDSVWLMSGSGGGGGSGSSSGVSSINGLSGAVVLDADDLADGSTKVQMTTGERAKLTGIATGATANATDAQLRNRATHTGTQPVSSLTTSGTASATTYLRGDGSWATPVSEPALNAIGAPTVGDAVQRIAWVAYAHPLLPSSGADNYWNRVLKYAPHVEIMIVNIDPVGGPGTSVNSDYVTAIEKAKASGVTVIGYVDTSYTARTTATVTNEVNTWRSLYPNIDGIFFDQASVNPVDVPYYQTLYNHVKNVFPTTTRRLVIINPGVFTDEAYMACCDIVMNFENTPPNYRIKFAPAWERKYPSRRFWHVVHGISGLTEMREMVALSRQYRAGYVWFTTDVMPNPFDIVPDEPFWADLVTSTAAVDPTWSTTVVSANAQTGTSYTLVIGDAGAVVEMSNASANTVTIPPNSAVAYPVGTVVEITQVGAGQTSVAAGSGVTLRAASGTSLRTQWSGASLRKRGTNEWVLTGDTV